MITFATEYKNNDVINLLIKAGADINIADKSESTPLHYAALNNNIGIMRRLIKAGADLNKMNDSGKTPLECLMLLDNNKYHKYKDEFISLSQHRLKKEDSVNKTYTGFEFDI